jgi:hypothetical protein
MLVREAIQSRLASHSASYACLATAARTCIVILALASAAFIRFSYSDESSAADFFAASERIVSASSIFGVSSHCRLHHDVHASGSLGAGLVIVDPFIAR